MPLARIEYLETVFDLDGKPLLDRNGEPINFPAERWIEVDELDSEAEARTRGEREGLRDQILAKLARNDLRSLRPLREGDTERLAAIEAEQALLRASLRAIG